MSAALWAALISVAYAESITTFEAEYTVNDDNTLTVHERIVYDFGRVERRGIYREVLSEHPQSASRWYRERFLDISPVSVQRNGEPEPYVNETTEGMFLRIGNPDVYITGEHVYDIVYRVAGALSVYPDGTTELYWNVTGSEWEVPIQNIAVRVSSHEETSPAFTCYVGDTGSMQPCKSVEHTGSLAVGYTTVFTEDRLLPGQEMTIAHEIKSAMPVTPLERVRWMVLIPVFVLFVLSVLSYLIYRWKTAFKLPLPIITQYEPYEDFPPMFTGVLFDNRLDSRDITAGIIYLAEQGFLSIKQTNKKILWLFNTHDYEVTIIKKPSRVPTNAHLTLIKLLFKGQAGLDGVQHTWFSFRKQKEIESSMNMYVGKTILLSSIKNNQSKLRANFKEVVALKKAIKADLLERGFFEKFSWSSGGMQWLDRGRTLFRGSLMLMIVSVVILVTSIALFPIVLLLYLFFAVVVSAPALLQRRTKKGHEALNYLKGFKDFLSTTEQDRYTFHNAPDKNPEQFMQYLPYAIAFGVEKEWAAVFKDIRIHDPNWYQSSAPGAHFNAVAFTNEISSFSNSLSGSTGTSAASGSGSAGGGAGGGGGGSW